MYLKFVLDVAVLVAVHLTEQLETLVVIASSLLYLSGEIFSTR